jgi:hypothetical protein
MKKILIIAASACIVSCEKKVDPVITPEVINVTAAVSQEIVATPSGIFKYWKSVATIDKKVSDTSYVIVQWDAYSAPGAYESTMKDTVRFLPQESGSVTHRSRIVYMNPWFAQEVKVVAAWDKQGWHTFKW